jgi:flagellar protein FlgJ
VTVQMTTDKLNLPGGPPDVSTYTDFAGLARLKGQAQDQSPETLKKVAQQFESLFLEMMLKSMREAKLGDGIFDSDAGELYQSMFDKQVAMDLATGPGGGLGIAELLIRQLGAKGVQDAQKIESVPPATGPDGKPVTPADFVREILPHAREAAKALGVHPLGLVAQAALETGWGRHVIPGEKGSSHNLFGIKAGEGWGGAKVATGTLEFENGLPVARRAQFRAYGSVGDSFGDYVKLLATSPRYKEVLEQGGTLTGFADALGRSGYATDPEYASKIKGILGSESLRDALRSLKVSDLGPMS